MSDDKQNEMSTQMPAFTEIGSLIGPVAIQ